MIIISQRYMDGTLKDQKLEGGAYFTVKVVLSLKTVKMALEFQIIANVLTYFNKVD